jgi:Mesyanzhinovviridae exonuclease
MDCMIDLETLGTSAGCVILSLGAVKFQVVEAENGESPFRPVARFSREIDIASAMAAGLTVDPNTLKWWLTQSPEALAALFTNPQPLETVLEDFSNWLQTGPDVSAVWSCGASFDLPILSAAYDACPGETRPWSHRQERCHRTLRELFGAGLEPEQVGTTHCAVDDAEFQARHLANIMANLGVNVLPF